MGKLTVKEIEAAKPKEKDVFLYDGDGLQLRIYPSGKRAWQLRYRLRSKRLIQPLGSYEHVSLKKARSKAAKLRDLISQGICPIEQEREERQQREAARLNVKTFKNALAQWHELELSSRKDGGAECIRAINKDITPAIGAIDITLIKRRELMHLLDKIVARGARRMANRTLTDLKQFFNWCEEREWIEVNPLHTVNRSKIGGSEKERDRVLSDTEIIELHDKMPTAKFMPHAEFAIWIMLSTLCRVGEITQARWEHINLDTGTWTIPATNSKNAKEHTVFLSDFSRRQFEGLYGLTGSSEWCMPSSKKEGHLDMKYLSHQIRDRQRETPLKNRSKAVEVLILSRGTWTPHDLRRTGATLMGNLGVMPEVIERCLNHIEPNRLKRTYQRQEQKAERIDAWQRLGGHMSELTKAAFRPNNDNRRPYE